MCPCIACSRLPKLPKEYSKYKIDRFRYRTYNNFTSVKLGYMLNSRLFSRQICSILPQQLTLEIKLRWIQMPFFKFPVISMPWSITRRRFDSWLIDWLDSVLRRIGNISAMLRRFDSWIVLIVWLLPSRENRWLDVGCWLFNVRLEDITFICRRHHF